VGSEVDNTTQAGRLFVEHPTLRNLGFEWAIRGDANRNATVSVRFRAVGESGGRQALPLVRIGGEHVYRLRENLDYTVPDGFAGSILNLQPGTEYECRLELSDPDGTSGQTVHTVRVKTRSEPQPSKEGRRLHVYPSDYKGARQESSFTSLLQAYYGAGLGDWNVVWERRAQPGDTILMHAGLYKPERLNYVDPMMTPFDGTMSLTLKNCRFEQVGFGVWTEYAGSSDFYIADNLFLGRDDRFRLIGWTGPMWASAGAYGSHLLTSYYAIKVYGPGHVIAHNAIAYFHDGIGISTYGTPPLDPDQQASSIDIYNNDLHLLNDDFVETDGGVHNVRVMNNRGVNAAQGGYSSQPVFGGPVYFIGNILYHVPTGVAFKFSAKPAGLFVYHNTIIGEQVLREPSSNMHFRNNLFLGRDTPGRGIMTWANATDAFSSDYNGFRPNIGVTEQYTWLAPRTGQRLYEPKPDDWKSFATLAGFRAATMQETHGVEVDFGDFEGLVPPDPAKRHAVYHAVDLNFRLKPASKAVDAGVMIPTVNDDFTGRAPDLGALEVGKPEPKYGPRWLTWQPFYR